KVLMFRKDLFDRNGLAYPDVNWNWDDLYQACKKISDPANGIYCIGLGRGKSESWYWITFLWSAGGEVMEYNAENDTWRCVFDSEAGVKALDFYTRLSAERWIDDNGIIRRGYAYKDARDASAKWVRGEIAMRVEYINERSLASFNPEINGIAPVPKGPTGMRGAELNSRMYGMFSEIENPVIRDAAWEYMYYWDTDDAAKVRTDVLVENGLGQFVLPKYLIKFGYSDIVRLAPKGWDEIFNIAIHTGKPEPYGKNSNFAYDQMSVPLQIVELMELNDRLPPPEQPEARNAVLREQLKEANTRANELMIGDISDAEQIKRRVLAILFLAAVSVVYFFVFRKIFRIFTPPASDGVNQLRWGFRKYFWAYVLLIPAVLTILIWSYLPLARGSIMAFYDYKILGESIFVGVDNFGNLLMDNMWWSSIWNAIRYSLLVIAMTFLPPMILAILLQEVPKGKLIFRMIYYMPAVISGLVTMLLWKQFYEPSEFGVLNRLVLQIPAIGFIGIGIVMLLICLAFAKRLWFYQMWLPLSLFVIAGVILLFSFSALARPVLFPGGETWTQSFMAFFPRLLKCNSEPYRWLFNPNTAMISCVVPMVWAGMGPGCLIYLAALKGIPEDYYEAADLDGATFIDKILFVVFPTLKALVVINFVGVFITSWYASTGNILVMTGGDAATKTETAGLFIWYKAFTYLGFGPATAAAWMLAFMLIGFTVYQLQILSKVEFRAGGAKK
ncbi:MAG: extracellular solute-binding protein, partial [Victivallaceae bacterium]|nr:extracellular solute-binding protein [Victivallaceae bacterium]